MSRAPLTPDEFARRLALPPGDSERQAAESSSEFAAMRRMLSEFEQPNDASLDEAQVDNAKRQLARRLAVLGVPHGRPADAGAEARDSGLRGPRWFESLLDQLHHPVARSGLAFAAILIVASVAWWSQQRGPAPGPLRGASESATIAVDPPRFAPGSVTLSWSRVSGADSYRVTFFGADLTEVARRDSLTTNSLVLQAGELPPGLQSGQRVAFAVAALRGGDTISDSKAQFIQLP